MGTEAHGGRPARTSYRLTVDGETEFLGLLRHALWNVDAYAADSLLAAWSFSWALARDEVVAAFEHRLEQIDARAMASEFAIEDVLREPEKPSHVASTFASPRRGSTARRDGPARCWSASVTASTTSPESVGRPAPSAAVSEPGGRCARR